MTRILRTRSRASRILFPYRLGVVLQSLIALLVSACGREDDSVDADRSEPRAIEVRRGGLVGPVVSAGGIAALTLMDPEAAAPNPTRVRVENGWVRVPSLASEPTDPRHVTEISLTDGAGREVNYEAEKPLALSMKDHAARVSRFLAKNGDVMSVSLNERVTGNSGHLRLLVVPMRSAVRKSAYVALEERGLAGVRKRDGGRVELVHFARVTGVEESEVAASYRALFHCVPFSYDGTCGEKALSDLRLRLIRSKRIPDDADLAELMSDVVHVSLPTDSALVGGGFSLPLRDFEKEETAGTLRLVVGTASGTSWSVFTLE